MFNYWVWEEGYAAFGRRRIVAQDSEAAAIAWAQSEDLDLAISGRTVLVRLDGTTTYSRYRILLRHPIEIGTVYMGRVPPTRDTNVIEKDR